MSKSQTRPRSPTLRQALLLVSLTILICCGGTEVGARIAGLRSMSQPYLQDSAVGFRWFPGFDGVATTGRTKVSFRITISSQSLRDREFAIPKPPGITRFVVVGDSVAAGLGVAVEDTFAKQLEARFDPADQIEIVNGAVPDYSSGHEFAWLKAYGVQFQPDAVILAYVMNDPLPFVSPPSSDTDKFLISGNNFLVRTSAAYGGYLSWLGNLGTRYAETGGRFRNSGVYWTLAWRTDPDALARLFADYPDEWMISWNPDAFAKNLEVLDQMVAFTRSEGIPLVLLIVPSDLQVNAQSFPPEVVMDAPQQGLIEWANGHQVCYIDPLSELREKTQNDLFLDQTHLTVKGNTLLADILYRELENNPECLRTSGLGGE
jgi:lysophospholipase L1-like esterase